MASIDFRQSLTTTCRSSAETIFTPRLDAPTRAKPRLLGLALFYGLVIAVIALRVTVFLPAAGQ